MVSGKILISDLATEPGSPCSGLVWFVTHDPSSHHLARCPCPPQILFGTITLPGCHLHRPSPHHGEDVLGFQGSSMENVLAQDYQQEEQAQEHVAQVAEDVVEGTKAMRENTRESRHQRDSETERRHERESELSILCFPLIIFS